MQLKWLHISDLHFLSKKDWRDGMPRKALIEKLSKIVSSNDDLRPDFIFCTGDIAFGEIKKDGLLGQYQDAAFFFDALLMACGSDGKPMEKSRLFIVPGNHDVNRSAINEDAQRTLIDSTAKDPDFSYKINNRVAGREKPFSDAMDRLSEYSRFIADYAPHLVDKEGRCIFHIVHEICGLKVGIGGFNSAWASSGEEDDRHLWLPAEWSFNRMSNALSQADIRIGLVHHPIDWLCQADRSIATRRIISDFDFWLHGHIHDPWISESNGVVVMSAGAVGADESQEFGFHLVSVDAGNGSGESRVYGFQRGSTAWLSKALDEESEGGVKKFKHLRLASRFVTSKKGSEKKEGGQRVVRKCPRFWCAEITHRGSVPLDGSFIPYRQLSNPIEDELGQSVESTCIIWMPRERYFAVPNKYTAAVALCVSSAEATSIPLRRVIRVKNGIVDELAPKRLSEKKSNLVYTKVCQSIDKAFVAAYLLPDSLIKVGKADWMLSYDTILGVVLPSLADLHMSAGFSSVNFVFGGLDSLAPKVIEKAKRILRSSSLSGVDTKVLLSNASDDYARLYYAASMLSWAVHLAYNAGDSARLEEIMDALGGTAPTVAAGAVP